MLFMKEQAFLGKNAASKEKADTMTTFLIILLIGLVLISAVIVSVVLRLRPPRSPRGRHTTALHHVIFGKEEE